MLKTVNQEQILKTVELKKDNIIDFLRRIIAIPSTSTKEKDVVQEIKKEMEKLNYDKVWVDKAGNIIGQIGSGKTKIAFDSHIDTVDIGDIKSWKHDPFQGKVENEIIYGRGTSDNKGATACQIYGAAIMKELGLVDDFTIYVVGTVQEEDCDGASMLYMFNNSIPKPDYVVLGECTDLCIYRGHRGRMEMSVTAKGKSCHGSAPDRGENAIYKMAPIISAIEKLNDNLKDDDFLGKGTIVVSKIECQTPSLNSVPDECKIYIDRRLTVGETKESSVKELEDICKGNAKVDVLYYDTPTYTDEHIDQEKYYPTWVLPEDHKLVQAGIKTAETLFGAKPKVSKWVFSTNGVASMGKMNIPTIGYGPSKEEYAHTADDQITVDHIKKATAFYTAFANILANNI
ncbi:MAG: YgeY family selenium metabolism-linked hydrolase [Armatimonadota bacterium]